MIDRSHTNALNTDGFRDYIFGGDDSLDFPFEDDGLRDIWMDRHYKFDNPLSVTGVQAVYEKIGLWLEELRVYLDENFEYTKSF